MTMSDELSKIKHWKRRLFKSLRDDRFKPKREPNAKKEYHREPKNYKKEYEEGKIE